ncbi:YdeI/OmpD-associated family protein [Corallococcus sp. AS-1-6]|uniref:YdeI/OmpD-associated family protein n=1 Tax=Corallococcus TaxID=83461 RepID=UPI001CBC178B|nr:YdeI/OmpD-associated family protein [Corallococcus sp. AS-1-6]MBZ4371184.1 YdeI/OmpD-associated family protein [Corallococcus sp. AS-1-6]
MAVRRFKAKLEVANDQGYGGITYLGFTKEVEVPEDLQRALDAEPALRDVFTKLAFTHRKEFVKALTEAKKEETRARRLAQTLETLRARAVK